MSKFLLFSFILLTTVTTQAQQPLKHRRIVEAVRTMSEGDQNALTIYLQNYNHRQTKEVWTSYLKKFGGKTTTRKYINEIFTDNAKIKNMSKNKIDIYSQIIETEDGCELLVWFYLGGKFLSRAEHGDKYHVGADIIYDFTSEMEMEVAKAALKRNQDSLKVSQRDLARTKKKEEQTQKEIALMEAKIAEKKKTLETHQTTGEETKKVVIKREEMVTDAKKRVETMKYQ
jgi:hypothetical protein